MGVGAPDDAGAALEEKAHRELFAGGLGVHVNEDDLRRVLRQQLVGDDEGIVRVRIEREAPYEVQNADAAEGHFVFRPAPARALGREVCGTQSPRGVVQIGLELIPCPGVVSERDDVRSRVEHALALFRRYADDVRIFAVDGAEAYIFKLFQRFEVLFKEAEPRLPADVTDRENIDDHFGCISFPSDSIILSRQAMQYQHGGEIFFFRGIPRRWAG